MHAQSSFISFTLKNSILIVVAVTAYIIAILTLNFALSVPMMILGILSPVAFIYLVNHPRVFIYFIIPYWPFNFAINKFFSFLPGGNQYLSVNLLGVIFVIGTVLGLVVLAKDRVRIFDYRMTVPMILFFIVMSIGVIMSPMKFWAFRFLFRYGMPAILYFLILEKIDDEEAERLLKLTLIGFIPVILTSYYQIIMHGSEARYEETLATGEALYRLAFSGFHANTIGLYFPIYIMLSMYFYFETGIKYKWSNIFLMLNMIVLLFHTYSRMGWVCFVAGMITITMLRSRKFFLVFVIIGAFILAASPFLTQRIESRMDEKGSIESRIKRYELAWQMFLQKPVLGHGQGGFQLATSIANRFQEHEKKEYGIGGAATHNEYLRILSEGGIIGITVFLILMYRFIKLSFELFKWSDERSKNYGAFFLSIMVISLLSGIPGHGFMSTNFYVWTFAAIGEIMLRKLRYSGNSEHMNRLAV